VPEQSFQHETILKTRVTSVFLLPNMNRACPGFFPNRTSPDHKRTMALTTTTPLANLYLASLVYAMRTVTCGFVRYKNERHAVFKLLLYNSKSASDIVSS